MSAYNIATATLMGLLVGSFLNVVIWRLPRGQNLSKPRSRCPTCNKLIRWFDNVPVLSWIMLGARCRHCKGRISARYPFVELLTGALFFLAAWRLGNHVPTTVIVSLALAALIAISFIDWDLKIIPDAISKPGIVLAIACAPLMSSAMHPTDWLAGLRPAPNQWLHACAGALAGALIILAIRTLGSWIMKKEAMGLGDVKLLAFIGALVGPMPVVYVFVLGCFFGAILGGLMFAIGKRRTMPLHATVRAGDASTVAFARGKLTPEGCLWLPASFEETASEEAAASSERGSMRPAAGESVEIRLILPADRVLEETDAEVLVTGEVSQASQEGLRLTLGELDDTNQERLEMFRMSYRYVPFGPFLSIAGALVMLFGPEVHEFVTVGYPAWVRSLSG